MRKPVALVAITAIFLLLMSALIIDGAVPQIKMALKHGYVPGDYVPFKVLLLTCIGTAFVCRLIYPAGTVPNFEPSSRSLGLSLLCLSSYLIIHLIVSFLFLKKPLFFLLFSYVDSLFFLFLLIPIMAAMRPVLPWRPIFASLIFITIPLCAIGLYQFARADTVLPTLSNDMNFRVYGWAYYGRVRAFSLFGSGLKFAYFLSLVGSIVLAAIYLRDVKGLRKFFLISLFALVVISCGATITRNGFITMGFSLISVYLLARRPSPNHVWLPAIYVLLALVAALAGGVLGMVKSFGQGGSISSSESLGERLSLWQVHLATWLQTDIGTIFFGTGFTQSRRFSGDGEVVLDNVFLAMGYQLGMIGLLIFVFCYVALWRLLFQSYLKDSRNPVRLGLVAFWSTFLSSGVFNTSQNFYFFLVPLALALATENFSLGSAKPAKAAPALDLNTGKYFRTQRG